MIARGRAIVVVGLTIAGILSSCAGATAQDGSQCIPPNATSGYDLGLRRQDETNVPRRKSMPGWWEPQLDVFQHNVQLLRSATDVATRLGDEIWIAGYPIDSDDSILLYSAVTRKIQGFAVLDSRGRPFMADDLLVASDNSLWALLDATGSGSGYSALAKYVASKNHFDIVDDEDGLLRHAFDHVEIYPNPPQTLLAQEPDGRLVIGMNGEIYEYDPATNRAVRLLAHNSGFTVTSLAVSQGGDIWFVAREDNSIRELDPASGTISDFGPPPGSDPFDPNDQLSWMAKPLEIDEEGRVWVADFGWLGTESGEARYKWHAISRSTIFLSIYDPEFLYKWERPSRVYQSSNGDIWFVAFLTTVQFSPDANTWCWSSTRSGPMAEDRDGNLWLVDRQIYRYEYELYR
ncbi:MAG: hypothetical protein WBZ24_09655 [Anaerolineales bacterium]|jgi:hypothetical protein